MAAKRNLSPEAAARHAAAVRDWHRQNYDQVMVYVPKGCRQQYRDMARRRGTTLNAMVNAFLEQELNKNPPE